MGVDRAVHTYVIVETEGTSCEGCLLVVYTCELSQEEFDNELPEMATLMTEILALTIDGITSVRNHIQPGTYEGTPYVVWKELAQRRVLQVVRPG